MSSNISELQKLYAKEQTIKVGDASLELKPLSLDDMAKLENVDENSPFDVVTRNAKKMFAMSLGVTEEEAAKISFEHMEELLGHIMKANNFKDEDVQKTGIKDFIKKKKELAEAKNNNG